jgi:hypothetical protein
MAGRTAPIKYFGEPEFNLPGQWRTARKAHACDACGQGIEPGDRYYEYTGESEGYHTGDAYHRVCAIEYWRKWLTVQPAGEE